jgi:hypothetical protein
MTKKQAEKHSEIIKWFIDNPNKGVYCKHPEDNLWRLSYSPTFDTILTYVQNDEYVELRKAQTDGKTIQIEYKPSNSKPYWRNYSNGEMNCFYKENNYRIKPDKPEFKVGDWVTANNGKPHQFKRFTKELPTWNKALDYENIEMLCHYKNRIPNFDRSMAKTKFYEHKSYLGFANKLPNDPRQPQWEAEYNKTGFDETVTWSLDDSLIKWFTPRLRKFLEMSLETTANADDFHKDIKKILKSFDLYLSTEYDEFNKKHTKKLDKSFKLLAKNYRGLWW